MKLPKLGERQCDACIYNNWSKLLENSRPISIASRGACKFVERMIMKSHFHIWRDKTERIKQPTLYPVDEIEIESSEICL